MEPIKDPAVKEQQKLVVTCSPHVRSKISTPRIMLDVVIALCPAAIMAVVLFGWRALAILAVCIGASVLSEYLFTLITKRPKTVGDFSAVVTGLLLALNLPSGTRLWQCAVGAVFAVIVVKCLFGGLGCNFANPAIAGRVFMMIAFAEVASVSFPTLVDLEASATPLAVIKAGGAVSELPKISDMLFGLRGGAIGEGCVIALLVGYAYLCLRKIIHWETPAVFVATVFLLTLAIKGDALLALYGILSGGLLIGAIFMATDYVTTPVTRLGKICFAFGCGVITVLIRLWGAYPEGVSFAILLMNILSPYIEKWTAKRPLGVAKKGGAKA